MKSDNNSNEPLVTVLMPVFNCEKYLANAIDSILYQTYRNFRFLIINDGSTDACSEIIDSYSDSRMQVVTHLSNQGLVKTLNEGLNLTKSKYVVRMDADDVSLPERISKQVAFMESYPNVGLCGSGFRTTGEMHQREVLYDLTNDKIKFRLLLNNHFAHPCVIFRKSLVEKYHLFYDAKFIHAEDYELWIRFSEVSEVANLPEVLVERRIHEEQISNVYQTPQLTSNFNIQKMLLKKLAPEFEEKETTLFIEFVNGKLVTSFEILGDLTKILENLLSGNNRTNYYSHELFRVFFAKKYWEYCIGATRLGVDSYRIFYQSSFGKLYRNSIKDKLRFLTKALIKH